MKRSISLKFIAFILCTLSLVAIVFSGIGVAFMELNDLYHTPLETMRQEQLNFAGRELADYHAGWQAAETLSNAPMSLLSNIYSSFYVNRMGSQYAVQVYENDELVRSVNNADSLKGTCYELHYTVTPNYPIVTGEVYPDAQYDETTPAEEAMTDSTFFGAAATPFSDTEEASEDRAYDEALARVAGQEVLYSEQISDYYVDEAGHGRQQIYSVNYYAGPTYEVTVHLTDQAIVDADFMLVSVLYPYRDSFISVLLGALSVFLITLVYLCAVAGRSRSGEIHLAAINRIPLDLYLLCDIGCVVVLVLPVAWLFESALYENPFDIWDNPRLCLLICGLCGFGIAALVIGFLFAFAAQIKASNYYWLRHTVTGWCVTQAGKLLRWMGRGFGYFFRGCRAVMQMLPVIWQWLLTAAIIGFVLFITMLLTLGSGSGFFLLLLLLEAIACLGVVCYGAWCFGVLLKGAKHMAQGNLNYQIDTRYLLGCFRDFALQLNALAGAAQVAAERQMKSERMKTELITNVSHDIKTPLTSIINYVDLLKKPHSDAEGDAYLDVLDRQSQRLKKLIEDLMEMSKASSGNLTVEIGQVDVVEAVNQALGEFSDKLEKVNLTPVFRHPDMPVVMRADGRLVWRVLSNLLSNAVKYAMPDTRLYVDLMVLQGNAVLAIKNISRDQLNVNADELMERFVRGDTSRNTEGSGLGLNIAKSLVELQKGQMHLMVDGDLVKVTLIFPLI